VLSLSCPHTWVEGLDETTEFITLRGGCVAAHGMGETLLLLP
jgi:hypothetical protein